MIKEFDIKSLDFACLHANLNTWMTFLRHGWKKDTLYYEAITLTHDIHEHLPF